MGMIWRNTYNKYVLILILALFFIIIPINKKQTKPEIFSPPILAGDTLNCYIMLNRSLYSKGHSLGFIYEIFGEFEKEQGCKINLQTQEGDKLSEWIKLAANKTDMVIMNAIQDTVPDMFQDDFISSIPINSNEDVVVVQKSKYKIVQTINYWLTFFKQSPEYNKISKNFYKRVKHTISPYDDYIKQYAKLIDWDWRLLASLICQESKFKLGVSSSKGAIGLMQIKESIANTYGIDDIYDPESNIKAGVYHLQRLQNMYRKMGADSLNTISLTLASYNAGEGRMEDMMNLTSHLKKSPLKWGDIAEVIPLMNDKDYYTLPSVKLGRFKGNETVRFVDQIIKRYEKYQSTVE